MPDKPMVERFESSGGSLIFRIPLEVFPDYIAYAYLVAVGDHLTLIDVGTGFGSSHTDLVSGLEQVQAASSIPCSLENLDRIIITHGHIDHFGGLSRVKEVAKNAQVGVHDLARLVLINYDERVLVSRYNVAEFLRRAGVPEDRQDRLMNMYMLGKQTYTSVPVDFSLKDGELLDGVFRIIHVPGHTPGLVMIQIDDILLTADHILPKTSVALAPESMMPYTGVGHYIESLEKALGVEGVELAMGGHEWPMPDYYAVAERTLKAAHDKVDRVLDQCDQPRSIYEIAKRIYGDLDGYSEMLKVWQTGARIEYLNQRGLVMIDNLDALEHEANPVLRYSR